MNFSGQYASFEHTIAVTRVCRMCSGSRDMLPNVEMSEVCTLEREHTVKITI